MKTEVHKYIDLLRNRFPNEPKDVFFSVKAEMHDFGLYYEAVVQFDDDDKQSADYAYFVESNTPASWDDSTVYNWKTKKPL